MQNKHEIDMVRFIRKIIEKKILVIVSFLVTGLVLGIVFVLAPLLKKETVVNFPGINTFSHGLNDAIVSGYTAPFLKVQGRNSFDGLNLEITHFAKGTQHIRPSIDELLYLHYNLLMNYKFGESKNQALKDKDILEKKLTQLTEYRKVFLSPDGYSGLDTGISAGPLEGSTTLHPDIEELLLTLSTLSAGRSKILFNNYIKIIGIQLRSVQNHITRLDDQILSWRAFAKTNSNHKISQISISNNSVPLDPLDLTFKQYSQAVNDYSIETVPAFSKKDIIMSSLLIIAVSMILSLTILFLVDFTTDLIAQVRK